MVLRALGLFQKFFWAESDPKVWFGCIAHNLMHYSRLFVCGWSKRCRRAKNDAGLKVDAIGSF